MELTLMDRPVPEGKQMKVLGICRFSFVGKGDWKAYRNVPNAMLYEAATKQAEILFNDRRMEQRLASFEHLTLASLKDQSDPDFKFLVVSSELMPSHYRQRLDIIASKVPQCSIHYAPLDFSSDLGAIIHEQSSALGFSRKEALQFRLDDDDCLFSTYVAEVKSAADMMASRFSTFAISFPDVLYVNMSGDWRGAYRWHNPFFGVGAATFSGSKGVYGYGHYKLPRLMPALTIPNRFSLVTHSGLNDTEALNERKIKKNAIERIVEKDSLLALVKENYPFFTKDSYAVSGLADILND